MANMDRQQLRTLIAGVRTKAGRALSAANEAKLAAAEEQLAGCMDEHLKDIHDSIVSVLDTVKGDDPAEQKEDDRVGQERRSVFPMSRLKVAEPDGDGKRRIEGYASVFGNRDSYGDIVVRGAFERTLKERPDVKVLWQHDSYTPMGKQESGYENEYGLVVRGVMSNTRFFTEEALPLLLDGVVNGLSIGYQIVKGESSPDGYLLLDLELFEWSPVTFPANESAQVTQVKSLDWTRRDAHADRVDRAAKQLQHELSGFFKDERHRDALPLPSLVELESNLRGTLAGSSSGIAADAVTWDQAVEIAYLAGLTDGLDLN